MYTEQDLTSIRAQQKKRWLLLAIPCTILLAVLVVSLIVRLEWLTTLSTIFIGCSLVFVHSLTIRPLRRYEIHLNNCLHGRTRELDGKFDSLSPDLSVVDGVKYYALSVLWVNDEGDEVERLLYWDAEKPFPTLAQGTPLHIVYHDREVAALTVA